MVLTYGTQSYEKQWGETIRTYRTTIGLSQAEFAGIIGVDTATISRWENGIKTPANKYRIRIAAYFRNDPNKMFPLPIMAFEEAAA
jgi:transcriptional regulator with XRE-family HTH domain